MKNAKILTKLYAYILRNKSVKYFEYFLLEIHCNYFSQRPKHKIARIYYNKITVYQPKQNSFIYINSLARGEVTKHPNPSMPLVRCLTFSLKSRTNEVLAISKLSHGLKDPRRWESGFVPRRNKRTMHERSLIQRHPLHQHQRKFGKLFFLKNI